MTTADEIKLLRIISFSAIMVVESEGGEKRAAQDANDHTWERRVKRDNAYKALPATGIPSEMHLFHILTV